MVSVVMVPSHVHVEMWLGQVRMSLILNYLPFWKNKNFSFVLNLSFLTQILESRMNEENGHGDVMVRMTS